MSQATTVTTNISQEISHEKRGNWRSKQFKYTQFRHAFSNCDLEKASIFNGKMNISITLLKSA